MKTSNKHEHLSSLCVLRDILYKIIKEKNSLRDSRKILAVFRIYM